MDYFLHTFALTATIIAIIGSSSAGKNESLMKKLLIGSAMLAFLVFFVSATKTFIDNKSQEELTAKIKYIEEQERQKAKLVYQEFVPFYESYWDAPNLLSPGDIVEFNGFDCEIELTHEFHSVSIPSTASQPYKYTIMDMGGRFDGPSSYKWQLSKKGDEKCSGQVHVFSVRPLKSVENTKR